MAGYFVSVEGVEGVGKSTIIQFIQSLFVEFGAIILIREAWRHPVGRRAASAFIGQA